MLEITVAILTCIVALIVVGSIHLQSKKVDDPENKDFLYTEQLKDAALLSDNYLYDVAIWRQSGEIYKIGSAGVSRNDAIKEVLQTFKRANIDTITIRKNTTEEIEVYRLFHNGRGRQEGKRVGGASIKKVLWQAEPEVLGVANNKAETLHAVLPRETADDRVQVSFNTEAKKAIARAFFAVKNQALKNTDSGDAFTDLEQYLKFLNPESGEGEINLPSSYLGKFLCLADLGLGTKMPITDALREKLLGSSVRRHRVYGEDERKKFLIGIETYGNSSPSEIFKAFEEMCEKATFSYDAREKLKTLKLNL